MTGCIETEPRLTDMKKMHQTVKVYNLQRLLKEHHNAIKIINT